MGLGVNPKLQTPNFAMSYQNSLEFAKMMDEKDPLRDFRDKFFIPRHNGQDCVYLTGNSLGLQPKTTAQYVPVSYTHLTLPTILRV